MDPSALLVENNGEYESTTGLPRIKIWCEAEPTLAFINFLGAATNGIENLENVVKSNRQDAQVELVFAPNVRNPHKIAGQFILEVNSRLRVQPEEMLEKLLFGTVSSDHCIAVYSTTDWTGSGDNRT